MGEKYGTGVLICGLRDIAGWLENEGGRDKHVRQIRAAIKRMEELAKRDEDVVKAVRDFHSGYLAKFGRPSTGGARSNAPLREELGALLLIAYKENEPS